MREGKGVDLWNLVCLVVKLPLKCQACADRCFQPPCQAPLLATKLLKRHPPEDYDENLDLRIYVLLLNPSHIHFPSLGYLSLKTTACFFELGYLSFSNNPEAEAAELIKSSALWVLCDSATPHFDYRLSSWGSTHGVSLVWLSGTKESYRSFSSPQAP